MRGRRRAVAGRRWIRKLMLVGRGRRLWLKKCERMRDRDEWRTLRMRGERKERGRREALKAWDMGEKNPNLDMPRLIYFFKVFFNNISAVCDKKPQQYIKKYFLIYCCGFFVTNRSNMFGEIVNFFQKKFVDTILLRFLAETAAISLFHILYFLFTWYIAAYG